MSEIKLPSEVRQSLQSEFSKQDGYHYWNGEESIWVDGNSEVIDAASKGAKIAATHYEKENKRVVELLMSRILHEWNIMYHFQRENYNNDFETYWLQYCKENNIK